MARVGWLLCISFVEMVLKIIHENYKYSLAKKELIKYVKNDIFTLKFFAGCFFSFVGFIAVFWIGGLVWKMF